MQQQQQQQQQQPVVLDDAVTSNVVKKALGQSVEMRHNLKDSLAELDMQLKSVHHWKVEHFEMSFEEHLEQVEYNKQNKINNKTNSKINNKTNLNGIKIDSNNISDYVSLSDSYATSPKTPTTTTTTNNNNNMNNNKIPSSISLAVGSANKQNPSYNNLYSSLENTESGEVVTDNVSMFARHRTPRSGQKNNHNTNTTNTGTNGMTSHSHSPYLDTKVNLLSKINNLQ